MLGIASRIDPHQMRFCAQCISAHAQFHCSPQTLIGCRMDAARDPTAGWDFRKGRVGWWGSTRNRKSPHNNLMESGTNGAATINGSSRQNLGNLGCWGWRFWWVGGGWIVVDDDSSVECPFL